MLGRVLNPSIASPVRLMVAFPVAPAGADSILIRLTPAGYRHRCPRGWLPTTTHRYHLGGRGGGGERLWIAEVPRLDSVRVLRRGGRSETWGVFSVTIREQIAGNCQDCRELPHYLKKGEPLIIPIK